MRPLLLLSFLLVCPPARPLAFPNPFPKPESGLSSGAKKLVPSPKPKNRGLTKAEKILIGQSSEENEIASKDIEISSQANAIAAGVLLVAFFYPVFIMAEHKAERLQDKAEKKMERLEDKISDLQQQKLSIQLQSKCKLFIATPNHSKLTAFCCS